MIKKIREGKGREMKERLGTASDTSRVKTEGSLDEVVVDYEKRKDDRLEREGFGGEVRVNPLTTNGHGHSRSLRERDKVQKRGGKPKDPLEEVGGGQGLKGPRVFSEEVY